MADADHLVRLTLAAVRCAEDLEGAGIADGAEALPELRGDAPVIGILHHALEFAVFYQLAPFAAELEFVARIVDRPGAVGRHQHAVFDATDQLFDGLLARFDVEVGHAVDRRTVPAAGAAVGDAVHAGPELRQRTAQRAQQQAFTDQELLAGGCAVVVMAVAGELFGYLRIEGHVEQAGTVLQAAEVFGFDETGAGVIALVTEDAVQLQRVADGFVDLQHHLVGHQQQVALALRGVWRQEQLQRLVGHLGPGTDQAAAADDVRRALLAEVLAAKAAGLAVVAVVGRDVQAGVHKTLRLAQFGAGAVQVDLLDVGDAEADLPVHQALVAYSPQQSPLQTLQFQPRVPSQFLLNFHRMRLYLIGIKTGKTRLTCMQYDNNQFLAQNPEKKEKANAFFLAL